MACPRFTFGTLGATILVAAACTADGSPDDTGGDSAVAGDEHTGDERTGDERTGDGGVTGDDAGGDPLAGDDGAAVAEGEDCAVPIVLTWDGSTIVRDDDTRPFHHDYLFEDCVAGQTWHYPNRDLVYRLDFPPGHYRVVLAPEWSFTYLSLIEVRTDGSCRDFETSCAALADSELTVLNVVHTVEVEAGDTVFVVVDSYGNLSSEPDMRAGPYTLSVESFTPAGLGEACSSQSTCADGMTCLDVDFAGPGYCTDLCTNVDCGAGAVAMQCGDVGAIHYHEGTEACVATPEVGSLAENDPCVYNFTCAGGLCVWPTALDDAECRVPCDGSCDGARTCVDITEDMYVVPSASVSVCVDPGDIGAVARNGECTYSYQCDPADFCPLGTCLSR